MVLSTLPANTPNLDLLLPRVCDVYDEEFLISFDGFDSAFIATLIYHGFMPIAGNDGTEEQEATQHFLMPKLHFERMVCSPISVHVPSKCKKLAKKYRMTVDTAFREVCKGIKENTFTYHEADCWLCDDLITALEGVNKLAANKRRGVSVHSIEIWDIESGELAAGEIGYSLGTAFSSMTGFYLRKFSGAGTLQLVALGRLLSDSGFTLWDFGMDLEYKRELGAATISRRAWMDMVLSTRIKQPARALSTPDKSFRELFAANIPKPKFEPFPEGRTSEKRKKWQKEERGAKEKKEEREAIESKDNPDFSGSDPVSPAQATKGDESQAFPDAESGRRAATPQRPGASSDESGPITPMLKKQRSSGEVGQTGPDAEAQVC